MKNLTLLLFILINFVSLGQDGPKVVVFNSSTDSSKPGYLEKDNLFKFNVFEAFAGDFSFYYERILKENSSAEIGLGVTLQDYFSALFDNGFDFADNSVEPLLGFSFSLGWRYYPFRAADEFYFAPEFKFKNYRNNKFYTDDLGNELTALEGKRFIVPRVTFGYLYFFDDNIFADIFAGFGIGSLTSKNLESSFDDVTSTWNYDVVQTTRLVPRFHLGLKIGFAL